MNSFSSPAYRRLSHPVSAMPICIVFLALSLNTTAARRPRLAFSREVELPSVGIKTKIMTSGKENPLPPPVIRTATIGTDHIDQTYLKQKNIGFSNAAGCNADHNV